MINGVFYPRMILFNPILVISSCRFIDLYSNGNGGAIFSSGNGSNLTLSYCSFRNCSSNMCGAICIEKPNRVATINCIEIDRCHAKSIAAALFQSNLTIIQHVSVSHSSPYVNVCENLVLAVYFGHQKQCYINVSYTNANHHSGTHQNSPSIYEETKYIHIAHNHNCDFEFGYNIMPEGIVSRNINIINNSVKYGLVYLLSTVDAIFYDFIFKSNVGTITAQVEPWIGTCSFIHCSFDSESVTTGPYVKTISDSVFGNNPMTTYTGYIFSHDFEKANFGSSCIIVHRFNRYIGSLFYILFSITY